MGRFLLVTIQVDMHDELAMTLQEDLTDRIVQDRAQGVLIDISSLEIVDSFIGRMIANIAGMARMLDPGPSADTPYETRAELLPKTLEEALAALRDDACFAEAFGKTFIDYYLRIKEAELARYHAEVTEWEQREYFELF